VIEDFDEVSHQRGGTDEELGGGVEGEFVISSDGGGRYDCISVAMCGGSCGRGYLFKSK
jgi:hypothetical protein